MWELDERRGGYSKRKPCAKVPRCEGEGWQRNGFFWQGGIKIKSRFSDRGRSAFAETSADKGGGGSKQPDLFLVFDEGFGEAEGGAVAAFDGMFVHRGVV